MIGTEAQIEWAERIRTQVQTEFDRVAAALSATGSEPEMLRALLTILEDKRKGIMSDDRAGYFIKQWQEPAGQVRTLILSDPRYREIRSPHARPLPS